MCPRPLLVTANPRARVLLVLTCVEVLPGDEPCMKGILRRFQQQRDLQTCSLRGETVTL